MPDGVVYAIRHETRYRYDRPVGLSHHLAHLIARDTPGQTVRETRLAIAPEPARRREDTDFFGNRRVYFAIEEAHGDLTVTARHRIDRRAGDPVREDASPAWEAVAAQARSGALGYEVYGMTRPTAFVPALGALVSLAGPFLGPGRPVLAAARDLTVHIHESFEFDPTATEVSSPMADLVATRRGVCQDFAHLMAGALRGFGLPARYVSGYLRTDPPPGQPRLNGADASHAWVSVFCPVHGWVDFDPTNGRAAGVDHVTLAWGRDFDDVSPMRGVILGEGDHRLEVSVDVVPEDPG